MGRKRKLKPRVKKIFRVVLLVLLLVGAYAAYWLYGEYQYRFQGIVLERGTIQLSDSAMLCDAAKMLEDKGIISSSKDFIELAHSRGVETIKCGNYTFDKGDSYRVLFARLHLGRQSPVRVTFNNIRTLEQLSGVLGRRMMSDSAAFLSYFMQDGARQNPNYIARFIPNTYEIYWSETPEKFVERMESQYQKFWEKEERVELAQKLNLTPQQVVIVASIVEEETNLESEMTEVAGVYINRLRRGIPLQADPTVKFAVGDFTIKRVLNKHLSYPSPYNTYVNVGLPLGPICSPSIAAIDATLNYAREPHNYLYFCAKADFSGAHAFATTLSQHNSNARKYHNELNRRKIR